MKLKLVEEHDGYDISELKIYQAEDGQYKKRFTCSECGVQVGDCFCWDKLETAVNDIEENRFLCSRHYVEEFYREDPEFHASFVDDVCGTKLDEKVQRIYNYECECCESDETEENVRRLKNECEDIVRNLTEKEVMKIYRLMADGYDCEFSGSTCNV